MHHHLSIIMKNLIIVILIFCSSILYCQEKNITNNIWISVGPGIYQHKYLTGFSLNSSLNWMIIKHLDTINRTRYKSYNVELRLNKYVASYDEDNYEKFTEFGLLYGKSFGKSVQIKFATGLGLLTGIKPAGYNPPGTPVYGDKHISSLGIPLVLGISLVPGKYFGLGIDGSINLYSKNTIYGVNIRLLFGKIR